MPSGSNRSKHVLSLLHSARQRKDSRERTRKHSVSTQKRMVEAFTTNVSGQSSTLLDASKGHWRSHRTSQRDQATHGEPVAFLTADWALLIREFKVQRGKIEDEELPARSCSEAFEEGFHDGTLEAETLAHFIRLAEEKSREPRAQSQPSGAISSQLSQCKTRSDTRLPCHRTRKPSEPNAKLGAVSTTRAQTLL